MNADILLRAKGTLLISTTRPVNPMLAELRDNFGTIKNLLSVPGFPILDPFTSATKRRILYCNGRALDELERK